MGASVPMFCEGVVHDMVIWRLRIDTSSKTLGVLTGTG
jgi:hypothetical protein